RQGAVSCAPSIRISWGVSLRFKVRLRGGGAPTPDWALSSNRQPTAPGASVVGTLPPVLVSVPPPQSKVSVTVTAPEPESIPPGLSTSWPTLVLPLSTAAPPSV